ncbi:hypothetical protein HYC85_015754 [Camellia sinensis]|uniref:Amino acid permease/ SLC12A domain-containing protein n=1 Tax=Camellia sinensis TaxID=4442 RepID=A0A7J7H1G2_CAMSI|nr:hypothetical protein HYC85_015754 [Camellia sinensis]
MFVGLSMAEICSSYPTSGGLYYWSAKLAGPKWAPFASWITGWFDAQTCNEMMFNIVGQTEETKNADRNGPKGIISAIGISVVVGWGYLLGITFAVTNIPYLLSEDNDAGGYAIAEIFYLAFKSRYHSGTGGIICLGVVAVAIFFCGMSSITSNSRMVYAFSRDGAMPLSPIWHKSLGSLVAFQAMVSIATIGLYIAYAFPIFFRVTLARKSFIPGPFNLGCFGILVGWIAVLWVATISILHQTCEALIQTLDITSSKSGELFFHPSDSQSLKLTLHTQSRSRSVNESQNTCGLGAFRDLRTRTMGVMESEQRTRSRGRRVRRGIDLLFGVFSSSEKSPPRRGHLLGEVTSSERSPPRRSHLLGEVTSSERSPPRRSHFLGEVTSSEKSPPRRSHLLGEVTPSDKVIIEESKPLIIF